MSDERLNTIKQIGIALDTFWSQNKQMSLAEVFRKITSNGDSDNEVLNYLKDNISGED